MHTFEGGVAVEGGDRIGVMFKGKLWPFEPATGGGWGHCGLCQTPARVGRDAGT